MRPSVNLLSKAETELSGSPEQLPELIDTHAHIHFQNFVGEVNQVIHRANKAGVSKIITVGVNTADSKKAAALAAVYENVWATVGIHPHEASEADQGISYLRSLAGKRKVVAIGECGLDFYKSETSPEVQERALRLQVELALELGLPLVFHVRDAFERFFKIMSDYPEARGVVHSFSAGRKEMEQAIDRGYLIALNGIMTFTKDESQLEAAKQVPLERLILETDCPFLSPAPHRGKLNEPARIVDIAEFLSKLRREPVAVIAHATTSNAREFFKL